MKLPEVEPKYAFGQKVLFRRSDETFSLGIVRNITVNYREKGHEIQYSMTVGNNTVCSASECYVYDSLDKVNL